MFRRDGGGRRRPPQQKRRSLGGVTHGGDASGFVIQGPSAVEYETTMRERIRKVYLALVGLGMMAGLYPLAGALLDGRGSDISLGDQMILGIYFPIGVCLLLASRNPMPHRSLIVAVGWSFAAHTGVMVVQAVQAHTLPAQAVGLILFGLVGIGLLAVAPSSVPVPGPGAGHLMSDVHAA